MKKVTTILFVLITMVAIATGVLFFYKAHKMEARIVDSSKSVTTMQNTFAENVYFNALRLRIDNKKMAINNLDSIRLSSIFNTNDSKLILRIKENQCLDCIDSLLHKVNQFATNMDPDQIVILASFHNTDEIRRLLKSKLVSYRMLNTTEDLFDKSIEENTNPSLFLLDSGLTVKSLHFVNVSQLKSTTIYIKSINQAFKNIYSKKYPITMAKSASIHFEKNVFNLGLVKYEGKAEAVATFKNNSRRSLVIASVETGCACTTAIFPHVPIDPGKTSSISVSYDTKRIGRFDQSVYVFSNALQGPVTLRIMGNVAPKRL